MDYGAFLPGYLSSSVDAVFRRLSHKLFLLESYDAVREKMNGGEAFVEATRYMQFKLIEWGMTDAYEVEEVFFPNYCGWAFRKKLHWAPLFNKLVNL